jgi:hypothetical protein
LKILGGLARCFLFPAIACLTLKIVVADFVGQSSCWVLAARVEENYKFAVLVSKAVYLLTLASSDGRCNTFQYVDSTMLPREK